MKEVRTKREIDSLQVNVGILIEETCEFLVNITVGEPEFPQTIHLSRQEPRSTTALGIELYPQWIAFTLPWHDVLLDAAPWVLVRPFVMVNRAIDYGITRVISLDFKPSGF